MSAIEVVVFSGGRGTRSIQDAFAGVDNIRVTYLINGYDSGLSTGEVRRAIPGMLGPSDFRKALTGIGKSYSTNHADELAKLFEHRLPASTNDAEHIFESWNTFPLVMEFISGLVPGLPVAKAMDVAREVAKFTSYVLANPQLEFDCSDLAIGNAYFGGAYITSGSFNSALEGAKELFELPDSVDILNVTAGDDLWLAVKTGQPMLSVEEGHFVTTPPPAPIDKVFLVDRQTFYDFRASYSEWKAIGEDSLSQILSKELTPESDPEAISRLEKANVIVYGSGTLHSSLLPSYLTKGVNEAIKRNRKALKILFVNGGRDVDIHESLTRDVTVELYKKYFRASEPSELVDFVTEIWVSGNGWNENQKDDLIHSMESSTIPVRQITEISVPQYSAEESYDAFSHALSRHVGRTLATKSNVVSIVIPMLNEAPRLGLLQAALPALEKTDEGALIEIIVADGGSNDGSIEQVQEWPDVRTTTIQSKPGRGSAILQGISEARGSSLAIFHADGEYDPRDIQKLISLATAHPSTIFVASRTHGAGGSHELRSIYEGHKWQYWISRTGGVVLSAMLSLRTGRSLSDPFSGIFSCNTQIAQEFYKSAGDIDSFIRFIIEANKAKIPIVEVGVNYKPRKASQGKKTNARTGLRALRSVFF